MNRSKAPVLFALLAIVLFFVKPIPDQALADANSSCKGIATAIFQVPFGRAFDELLRKAVLLNCGHAMDIGALRLLYASTAGESWIHHDRWITDNDQCSWYGVSCDMVGRVTDLELGENNLVGLIPNELGLLSSLGYLELAGNQIQGTIAPELGNIDDLWYLDLSGNQLSGSIPEELGNLSGLLELSLNDNQLNGPIPSEFGALYTLVELNLSSNQLNGPIPSELGLLTSLISLDLSTNQLTDQIPLELGDLSTLVSMDLSNNQLSGLIPPELGQLSELNSLDLGYNLLDGTLPLELGDLSSITHLNLEHNQLTGPVPSEFGNLDDLVELILSHNPLSGPLPLSLTDLENLITFYYNDTDLCEPRDVDFQAWLSGIEHLQGTYQCPAVVVLPGVMGSKLYNYNDPFDFFDPSTWPCVTHPSGIVWFDWVNTPLALLNQTLELKAYQPEPLHDCNHTYMTLSDEEYGVQDTYEDLIGVLRDAGYEVKFFSNDWRLSLEYNAVQLDAQINAWGYNKVYLIGHSMGGLLARTYIENPAYAAKVEKVITVGSPYLGAPDMAWEMRTGEVPTLPFLDLGAIAGIIRNSPGTMQLMPSDRFFETAPYYGYVQLIPPELIVLNNLEETNSFYASNAGWWGAQNAGLLNSANSYHDFYDDFSNVSVEYHVLSAANHMTRYGILQTADLCHLVFPTPLLCFATVTEMIGDGTVPVNSAINLGEVSQNVTIYSPYSYGEVQEEHGALTSSPVIQDQILDILAGTQELNIEQATARIEMPPAPFIRLTVFGSTEVIVSDGTYSSGIDENGVVYNHIPEARYQVYDAQTEVVIPSDRTYMVTFEQTGDIPLQFKVAELTAPSATDLFTTNQQAVFFDVPLYANGKATLPLDYSAGLDMLALSVFNDGSPEVTILPSSLLNAQDSQDYFMPVTKIQVDGTTDSSGYFTGIVTVILTASDAHTGILKSQYSLDGGQTWLDYQYAVSFRAEDVPVFYARSVDLAGNTEYPYPSRALRP